MFLLGKCSILPLSSAGFPNSIPLGSGIASIGVYTGGGSGGVFTFGLGGFGFCLLEKT